MENWHKNQTLGHRMMQIVERKDKTFTIIPTLDRKYLSFGE